MHPLKRSIAATATALLLAFAAAACGGDTDDGGNGDDAAGKHSATSDDAAAPDGSGGVSADASTGADGSGPASGSSSGAKGTAAPGTFCGGLNDVIASVTAVQSTTLSAKEWSAIQDSYAALGRIGAPDDASARQRQGLRIMVDGVTGLRYEQARTVFGPEGGGRLPGLTAEQNAKSEEFLTYAGSVCSDTLATP